MLLRHLYDLAQSRKLLDDLAFTDKAVRWVIALDGEGQQIGTGPQETSGERNRGKTYNVPKTDRPKVAGGIAEFLADGITAVFGLDSDPEKDKENENKRRDRDANNAAKCEDFWQQVHDAYDATEHPALKALLQFRAQTAAQPSFLRWGTSVEAKISEKPAWWLRTATGAEVKLGPENFTFEVEGKILLHDEQVLRPYWRRMYHKEVADRDTAATRGLCLITGVADVPIAATHTPKIKGVPNTQSFGAAIVSFDKPAFASYGFDQSHNAPASTEATTAYGTALNWLLNQKNHHLRIGQTAVCFWARDTEKASDFFAQMLDRPQPESVRDFLRAPWSGVDRTLLQHDEFYSVTLSGNAGRIVVRHWMQASVAAARENLRRWFADLEISSYGDAAKAKRKKQETTEGGKAKEAPQPLALYSLAVTTVREAKDLQAETLTQLYRAALEGVAPSLLLLKPLLNRLEIDLVRDGPKILRHISRFALLKLIINRNRKETDMEIKSELVADTDDAAYNCGRLLAVFDDLQMRAHDFQLEGAG
ncbi:MAG: type I-C CRISPR-associated protein Cas8c/Csd1, partial [Pyrinomonadaceae bacterium]